MAGKQFYKGIKSVKVIVMFIVLVFIYSQVRNLSPEIQARPLEPACSYLQLNSSLLLSRKFHNFQLSAIYITIF